ncbi:MAG: nucleotidyltransferase substrate binding protein [bacterium]|nr:nucleotidyltransferase substrate binding protein [bacterium]
MIEYDKFKKSLKLLEEQFGHYRTLDPKLEDWMQEAVKESVIQRFETCYDCMWKLLKRYLNEELGVPEVPNSPKPIFRMANENNLLGPSIDSWMAYAQVRIDTSHDYSGEKAENSLAIMGDFLISAIGLYQTMSGELWA